MEETVVKKRSPKIWIIIIVAVLFLVGGSASAFFIFSKSPKIQYIFAENNTMKLMGTLFEERYPNEMNWIDVQKKKPVETKVDLSAEWNDPYIDYDMEEIQSIVNSITLSMRNVYDPIKKENEFELGGELGSMEVKLGTLFATPEKLLLSVPFTDEIIRLDDKDFGHLMREYDEDYEGTDSLGLAQIFEGGFKNAEEINAHIKKEYLEYLFKELPEDAFSSEKEEIEVFDKNIKSTKLTMKLSEEQVKTMLEKLLVKLRDDKKLIDLLEEELAFSSIAGDVTNQDLADFVSGYEEGLDELIDDLDDFSMPNGIRSTIWHYSNRIVKREFVIGIGDDINEDASIKISGVQLLEKESQKWKYTISAVDDFDEEQIVKFTGDLSWKDKKSNDSISISIDDVKLSYKGKEELEGNKRTFNRTFGFTDGDSSPKFVWSGTATHESDSMTATHDFTATEKGMDDNLYNLIIKQQGKVVKKVNMPDESTKTINIGTMDMYEMEDYLEELYPKVENWFYELVEDIETELYDW